ncbi:MAG TPA: ABC transporter substrate-binding protein, partial [Gaiellaceae bacterium]|nr:ABC transporter substrate-binding protein [Gaiellaceae bacterium]
PAMPGHSHRIGPDYDPDLARSLLADAGYPEGRGLPELNMLVPPWLVPTAELLAEQAAEIGFRINHRAARGKFWSSSLADEHLWVSGFGADYPDPDGFFRGLFREPFPFYRDDEIEELLIQARSLSDQPERMKLYHDIDRLWINEHAAVLPIAYGRSVAAHRPWIQGFWANPLAKAALDQIVVEPRSAVAAAPEEPEAVQSQ